MRTIEIEIGWASFVNANINGPERYTPTSLFGSFTSPKASSPSILHRPHSCIHNSLELSTHIVTTDNAFDGFSMGSLRWTESDLFSECVVCQRYEMVLLPPPMESR